MTYEVNLGWGQSSQSPRGKGSPPVQECRKQGWYTVTYEAYLQTEQKTNVLDQKIEKKNHKILQLS